MSEILLPHLNGANFFYETDRGSSSDIQQIDIEHEAAQMVLSDLGRISRKLMEVPHDESGLDKGRINGFFERYGLAAKPFVGVDEAGQQEINEIMGYGRGPTQTVANYFPTLGFTYVLRGDYEAERGIDATEAEVIHELTHANQPHRDILIRRGRAGGFVGSLLQNGFVRQSSGGVLGSYFEEGFAEYMQHKYVIEELGLPHGFLARTKPQVIKEQDNKGQRAEYLLPGSYLYTTGTDKIVKSHTSAHGAYGMQLLIAQDPNIFQAMVASRSSTVGLNEFAGLIDALSQGLYEEIDAQPYENIAFAHATRLIIDTLYKGDPKEALKTAVDQDPRVLLAA